METSSLQKVYKEEKDPDVKERILIVIDLKRGKSSYEVGGRFDCPHSKVLYWKYRFEKYGIEGLRTRPRSGRPKKLSGKIENQIKKKLDENPHGWKTKSVMELLYKDFGVSYGERHIRRLMHKWGFERITPRPRHILADEKERTEFLKNEGFTRKTPLTVVCEDESIFVYDSVVRKIWARRGTRPIAVKTGSHRKTCVFGP